MTSGSFTVAPLCFDPHCVTVTRQSPSCRVDLAIASSSCEDGGATIHYGFDLPVRAMARETCYVYVGR